MTAEEYALNLGYIAVEPLPDWRGYKCYEALIANPEDVNDLQNIGIPQIVLEKDGKFHMADYDEAMAYIDELPEDADLS